MGFQTGNKLGGRKKGSKNKVSETLRKNISRFLAAEFTEIQAIFYELSPRERARLYCDLLQYSVPKLQATQLTSDLDKLTEQQVNEIFEKLKVA